MKKIIPILILLLNIIDPVHAQRSATDANIIGDVQCNGEHLPFINIVIEGSTIGTVTDFTGHFQLVNLQPGDYTIAASGVGYTKQKKAVSVNLNQTQEVKFELKEDILNLEAVVVTADRNETSRAEAPVVVNTIDSKIFSSAQAANIAGGLDFVPGLRMECNCQNCGFSQVRMNGLDGPYCQILINSRPVFSGMAGIYGLELIPTSMVDRIEIVRGGGSALFGGNAIAGTVNIITREPSLNTFSLEARSGVIGVGNYAGTDPASDNLLNVNGSIVSDDLNSGIHLYGTVRNRDPFDENGDDFSEMVSLKNTTLGFSTFYKPSQFSKISLDFYRVNEIRRGGNKFDYLPHEADIAEQVNHLISGGNLTYDLFTSQKSYNKLTVFIAGQQVDRDSYYGAEKDPNAYGNTKDFMTSFGGQYSINLNKISSLIIGVDNNYNKLKDIKFGSNGNPNSVIVYQYVNTLGTFAQYDWRTEKIKATVGLRYDNYWITDLNDEGIDFGDQDLSGNVIAPRINLLYDISPILQYRISYAKGYRPPQIFDEDLHIEASGSRRIVHANESGLKQESSHNLTSSFRYTEVFGSILTELLVEGFYTRLLDPFAYEYSFIDSTKTLLKTRNNSESGAFVAGLNLEFNAALSNDLTAQIGYTIQKSEYDELQQWGDDPESVTMQFLRTPGQYGFFTLDYHGIKNWDLSLTGTYAGSMYVPHYGLNPITDEEWELINSDDLSTIDPRRQKEIEAILNEDVIEGQRLEQSEKFLAIGFRVAYDFKLREETNLQVYAGIQNIFNQQQETYDSGVFRDSGYIYGPCQPRTINIGIKFGNIFE
ncbi:TonB-dependent receptor domain-containing protein [Bacteroidota bacterium]